MKVNTWCDPKTAYVLTEQEHIDSCDARTMLKMAARGQTIRTRKIPSGIDQQNFGSRSEILIEKQRLQEQINEIAQKHNINNEEIHKDPVGSILRKQKKAPAPIGADATTPPKVDSQVPGPQKQTTGAQQNDLNESIKPVTK